MISVRAAAVLVCLVWWISDAGAQSYPARPIRVIVPFPAGGGADLWARMIGHQLSVKWGQNFVVDNRAGASGIIGTEMAARAVPDGYTLLLGTTGTHATNPAVFKTLPYDPLRSFAPVTNLVDTPFMLVAHLSMPAASVAELVQLARSKPREFSYASFGNGSSAHLVGELFKIVAKIELTHIPYKGGPPAMTDLIGGHVTMMFNSLPAVVPLIKAGRLHGFAIASTRRARSAPDIPTFAEAGFPGVEGGSWYGLFAPAGTRAAIIGKLHSEIAGLLRLPEIEKRLIIEGADAMGNSPEQFTAQVNADIVKWRKVARDAGIQPE
jgi:tripartite-type tricarboxylate transporter receptor subunit TctC